MIAGCYDDMTGSYDDMAGCIKMCNQSVSSSSCAECIQLLTVVRTELIKGTGTPQTTATHTLLLGGAKSQTTCNGDI